MKSILFLIPSILATASCAEYGKARRVDYNGPAALVSDSAKVHSNSKVDYFYVEKLDRESIANNRADSLRMNQGRGFFMEPASRVREVPARSVSLEIVGRTEYAAPILTLANKVYEVKGKLEFKPVVGERYVVTGQLGEGYSAVWVENERSRKVVGRKVEIHGDASLGFFRK